MARRSGPAGPAPLRVDRAASAAGVGVRRRGAAGTAGPRRAARRAVAASDGRPASLRVRAGPSRVDARVWRFPRDRARAASRRRRDLPRRLRARPQPGDVGRVAAAVDRAARTHRLPCRHLVHRACRARSPRERGLRDRTAARLCQQAADAGGPLRAALHGAATRPTGAICGRAQRRRHRRRPGRGRERARPGAAWLERARGRFRRCRERGVGAAVGLDASAVRRRRQPPRAPDAGGRRCHRTGAGAGRAAGRAGRPGRVAARRLLPGGRPGGCRTLAVGARRIGPAARVRRVAVGGAGRASSRRRASTRGPVVARRPARLAPALDPRAARWLDDHRRAGGGRRARARRRRLAGAGNAPGAGRAGAARDRRRRG